MYPMMPLSTNPFWDGSRADFLMCPFVGCVSECVTCRCLFLVLWLRSVILSKKKCIHEHAFATKHDWTIYIYHLNVLETQRTIFWATVHRVCIMCPTLVLRAPRVPSSFQTLIFFYFLFLSFSPWSTFFLSSVACAQ